MFLTTALEEPYGSRHRATSGGKGGVATDRQMRWRCRGG